MTVRKVHNKTRGEGVFIARRPFLQLNRVSMRLGKHAEFGQRREQREKELGSK